MVCEAFACVPSVAVAELERDPALVFTILDLRGYASAKRAIEASTSMETHPPVDHPMVQAVYRTIADKQAEAR
jgi:hypothetical protein